MAVTKQQQLEWLASNIDDFFGCDVAHMSMSLIGQKRMAIDPKWHVITKEEWQQERDKMNKRDNSWHEHDELPLVGNECEIMHRLWIKPKEVKIAAITKEYVIVVDGQCEQHYYLKDITFRPLRTEREKAIDELNVLVGDIEKYPTWRDAIAGIIDAGYRKQ